MRILFREQGSGDLYWYYELVGSTLREGPYLWACIASSYSTIRFLYQRLGFVPEVMYIQVQGLVYVMRL